MTAKMVYNAPAQATAQVMHHVSEVEWCLYCSETCPSGPSNTCHWYHLQSALQSTHPAVSAADGKGKYIAALLGLSIIASIFQRRWGKGKKVASVCKHTVWEGNGYVRDYSDFY